MHVLGGLKQVMSLTVSRHRVLNHDGSGKELSMDSKLQARPCFQARFMLLPQLFDAKGGSQKAFRA